MSALMEILINDLLINVADNTVKIIKEIDRAFYLNIKQLFERYGGLYKTSSRQFVFKTNPKPFIQNYIDTGVMPEKNPTAFFPTPRKLVEDMIRVSDFNFISDYDEEYQKKIVVLEPSTGIGGIADILMECAPHIKLDTVEILKTNQEILISKNYNPYCLDFMDFNTEYLIKYDYVMMNPPFQGNTYLKHLFHAYKMLKDDGTLCAIIPTSFLIGKTKLDLDLIELIGLCGEVYLNEKNSFIETGTKVDTCIVNLSKDKLRWRDKAYMGHTNYYAWNLFLNLSNSNSFYNQIVKNHDNQEFQSGHERVLKDLILKHIDEFKKEQNFIPLKYTKDYVATMIDYVIEIYENANIDCNFLMPDNKQNNQNKIIYSDEQLKIFSSGSLF